MKVGKFCVRVGQTRVRGRRLGDGHWHVDGRPHGRKLIKRRTEDDARAEAARIAAEVHSGGATATAMTPADRDGWARVCAIAASLHTDPVALATEAADLFRLSVGKSPRERILAHVAAEKSATIGVPQIAADFIALKTAEDLDGRTKRDLRAVLTSFALDFPINITAVTPGDISSWLGRRCARASASPLSAKRRNHVHAVLTALFRHARKLGFLPDNTTAPQRIDRAKLVRNAIGYFTPEEMLVILRHVEDDWLPWPLFVGFGAVRVEELALGRHAATRKDCLRWEDIDWHEREIVIRSEVAKIGRPRRIPMQENLTAWLAPWVKAHGPVVPGGNIRGRLEHYRERYREKLRRLASQSDEITERILNPPNNALRHSYGSYRMAVTRNVQQVSNEMGDSPAMIQRHYDNPRPSSQARAWFSVMPQDALRTSQLILQFTAA